MINAIEYGKTILVEEGYFDWRIRIVNSTPSICISSSKEIWISKQDEKNIFMILHEIAHIDFPNDKGIKAHHYKWAYRFDELLRKYALKLIEC